MSCAAAEQLLRVAREKSEELGCKMNIAIVDSGANLVAFLRYRIHCYPTVLHSTAEDGRGLAGLNRHCSQEGQDCRLFSDEH